MLVSVPRLLVRFSRPRDCRAGPPVIYMCLDGAKCCRLVAAGPVPRYAYDRAAGTYSTVAPYAAKPALTSQALHSVAGLHTPTSQPVDPQRAVGCPAAGPSCWGTSVHGSVPLSIWPAARLQSVVSVVPNVTGTFTELSMVMNGCGSPALVLKTPEGGKRLAG